MSKPVRVHFLPQDKTVCVSFRTLLSDATQAANIPIRTDCGGSGTCGQCTVEIVSKSQPHAQNPSQSQHPSQMESGCQSDAQPQRQTVLACQYAIEHDIIVFVSENISQQKAAQIVVDSRETFDQSVPEEPRCKVISWSASEPSRTDSRSDLVRFCECDPLLRPFFSTLPLRQLQRLSESLRQMSWRGKAVLLSNRTKYDHLVEIRASDEIKPIDSNDVFCDDINDTTNRNNQNASYYAVALDVGTTTLAAELISIDGSRQTASQQTSSQKTALQNLHGQEPGPINTRFVSARENPQKRFGDDIISRIQKTIDSPDAIFLLQRSVLDAAAEMLCDLAGQAGIDSHQIILLTVSGNTVMQQIFLGIDPKQLGFSPFVPATNIYPMIQTAELFGDKSNPEFPYERNTSEEYPKDKRREKMPLHPNGLVQTAPILGGFVGGDLVSGILATGLDQLQPEDGPALLIDIGTNGEMVLARSGAILAAATAAGPAFEGARIGQGMIAAHGAIDRVDFGDMKSGSILIHTIGNGTPQGICGSALIDTVAELLRFGVLQPNGRFASGPFRSDIEERLTSFEGKPAFRLSKHDQRIVLLSQRDVRQLQLAAGAIRCGIHLLLEQWGLIPSDLRTIYLAGGFGNFIRPENATQIGLLPPEISLDRIHFCGNTSLAGAKLLARDFNQKERAEQIARIAKHLDLSTCSNFSEMFGKCMIFPEPINKNGVSAG